MFHVPEKFRFTRTGYTYSSTIKDGNNGKFFVKSLKFPHVLQCLASDQEGWEHVSVSTQKRCPTWEEMCFIKGLFWDETDCVIQYHPPKSDYVNVHPYCLHLWRPIDETIPTPPTIFV